MAQLGDTVYFFSDYGSANPVPMVGIVTNVQDNKPVIYVMNATTSLSGFILDDPNQPDQATSLSEALNPGNKWASREQMITWGLLPEIGS